MEIDLHEFFGIDTGEPGFLKTRSWRWLQNRIAGLLSIPPVFKPDGKTFEATRIGRILAPEQPPSDEPTE